MSFLHKKTPPKRDWHMGLVKGDPPTHCWIQVDVFDPAVNSELKRIMPGPYRWHSKAKRWIFPLTWDSCIGARKVADEYNALIHLTDGMHAWAVKEKARQETIPDVNSMELIELPRVRDEYPDIWEAVRGRPFQTVGAAFAARNRSCIIADDPGLGKTLQSIAAVVESGIVGPILVISPKAAAKLTWPHELARWVPDDKVIIIGNNMKPAERQDVLKYIAGVDPDGWGKRLWVLTSPNYLRIKAEVDQYGNYQRGPDKKKIIKPVAEGLLELQDVSWGAVIVDESHQTLPVPSGNKKKQSAQRLGIGALEVRHGGMRLALSGTPFRGKEQYLWGTLNWLRPDIYRSYWRWVEQYFDVSRDGWGTQIGRMIDVEGMYAEASKVMIRRTKAEVAQDLPPKMYGGWPLDPKVPGSPIAVWLDMEGAQKKAYRDMERQAAVNLESGTLMANGILAEMTRLKQFAGSYGDLVGDEFRPKLPSNKFDWVVEFLDERGIVKELESHAPKIVITSQFSKLMDCFADGLKELGIKTYKFTGATSDKDREAIKKDWQENPDSDVRVLLLTTTAGGVSLTLDAADELVVLDETWNPDDQTQVEDRLHRLSRMHQVVIWNLRSLGTIEEGIARNNEMKNQNIREIIDGMRGVSLAKELLNK